MPLWSFFDSHNGIIPVLTADLSVGFLTDYMKSTSKVSSDWKRQVAIFLWLVDERYNLGTTKTATSKASSSILEWNVKAVHAKKIIQFSTGFNYKEDLLSLRQQSLLISGDHCEKWPSWSYPQCLNLGCHTVMWSVHLKSQFHWGAYKKGNNSRMFTFSVFL